MQQKTDGKQTTARGTVEVVRSPGTQRNGNVRNN